MKCACFDVLACGLDVLAERLRQLGCRWTVELTFDAGWGDRAADQH
ncbi:MAG: hypothetical protein JJE23_00495 [Thermoleophilia bacterium]|nr:hypothetical protein [Thermoleophilia bacterium]